MVGLHFGSTSPARTGSCSDYCFYKKWAIPGQLIPAVFLGVPKHVFWAQKTKASQLTYLGSGNMFIRSYIYIYNMVLVTLNGTLRTSGSRFSSEPSFTVACHAF